MGGDHGPFGGRRQQLRAAVLPFVGLDQAGCWRHHLHLHLYLCVAQQGVKSLDFRGTHCQAQQERDCLRSNLLLLLQFEPMR